MKKFLSNKKVLYVILSIIILCGFKATWDNTTGFRGDVVIINGNLKTPPLYVTASQTLPKSAIVVLASGNITLQAPDITAADSGLTITVKNIGTYTDLVVFHISGTVADSLTDAKLTRWQTRTIIAGNNGKWYTKEKDRRLDYIYDVSRSGSFTTIQQAIDFLTLHMEAPSVIRLSGGTYPINNTITINLPYPISLKGFAFITTDITAATGLTNKPMFRCLSNTSFEDLQIDCTTLANYGNNVGEDCIRFVGNKTYNEIVNFSIHGSNIAILDSSDNEMWISAGDITGAKNAGIKLHSANDSVRMRIVTTDFIGCDKALWFSKGDKAYVDIDGGCGFRNALSTDTAVLYNPTTFTNILRGYLHGTIWNGIGTILFGADFSRPDGRDANLYVESNAGMESKAPHAKINVKDNATATTITAVNTFYKADISTHVVGLIFNIAGTSGTFTLNYGDQTTAPIAWNANDATIKSAIEALSNITTVTVTTVVAQKEWTISHGTANEGWQEYKANITSLGTTTVAYFTGNNYACKFKIETNRITYQPLNTRGLFLDISTNWLCSRNSVRYDVAVARFNSANVLQGYFSSVTGTTTASSTTSPSTQPDIHAYFDDVNAGDYFEIWVSKPTNAGDAVTLSDINWVIRSQ